VASAEGEGRKWEGKGEGRGSSTGEVEGGRKKRKAFGGEGDKERGNGVEWLVLTSCKGGGSVKKEGGGRGG